MNCKLCGKPVGLIHHCIINPPAVVEEPLIEQVRRALMMHEAGYDVGPPLLIKLAQEYFKRHEIPAFLAPEKKS